MDSCNFVLDLIVTNLESPEIEDFSATQIVAKVGGTKMKLSPSCINVTDFKTGAGVDIVAAPEKLRKNLEDNGFALSISYRNKVIGTAQIIPPQNTIDMVETGMSDLLYIDTCTIEREGEYVGKLEILCRIIIKCDDLEVEERIPCLRNVDKSINKQDILFVLSDPQRCQSVCDPCQEVLEPEEGDERLNLDMQRYRGSPVKSQRATGASTSKPVESPACCQLKQITRECEQMIDSLASRFGLPKDIKALSWGPDGKVQESNYGVPNQYFQDTFTPISLRGPCFSYIPAIEGDILDFCDPTLIPASISNLNKPLIKEPRFCPICLTNMSWLPNLAACPRCGAKAMPVIEERHKERRLTSEEIIREILGEPKGESELCENPCEKAERLKREAKAKEDESRGRCTCKCGEFCAHCRIRQLCGEIFKASRNEVECPQAIPTPSEDFCVRVNDPTDCKTHLSHVLCELRELYCMKDMLIATKCGQKTAYQRKGSFKKIPSMRSSLLKKLTN